MLREGFQAGEMQLFFGSPNAQSIANRAIRFSDEPEHVDLASDCLFGPHVSRVEKAASLYRHKVGLREQAQD